VSVVAAPPISLVDLVSNPTRVSPTGVPSISPHSRIIFHQVRAALADYFAIGGKIARPGRSWWALAQAPPSSPIATTRPAHFSGQE
jgi:hypothetical protein